MITVTATPWKLGWELELDTGGITQVRSLAKAKQQVREYLDTVDPDVDHTSWEITIVPEHGGIFDEVLEAKTDTELAQEATRNAAKRMKDAVRELTDSGVSMTDTAVILGVTKARVSQLVS
ncbi:MAG: antitoxin HicB [Propionibacteriaceae bacterium]|nr:antitoxin HicB [Propionibacteriaceae bacterium]